MCIRDRSEADSAADKVVQVIKRVLALPLSVQDKLMLLHKSLQMKMLHGGSEHFDPFKGASGEQLAVTWTDFSLRLSRSCLRRLWVGWIRC